MTRATSTLEDVANLAGVSKSTASRILATNQKKELAFAQQTRERVLEAAAKLGYRPSKLARGLSLSKTNIIGLVVPSLVDSFFPGVATAIESYLAEKGYSVILANSNGNAATERTKIEDLLSWRVDGLIIAPAQTMTDAGVFWGLWQRQAHFVLIDRAFPQTPFGSVTTDDERGAVLAVEHLVAQGRTRIARAGASPDISTSLLRKAGYSAALMRHGIVPNPEYAFDVPTSEEGGRAALARLLAMTPRPDALFCFSDVIAIGVLEACQEQGIRVPDDLAIVGFADLPHSGLLKTGLTTVRQPRRQLGQKAAEMLVDSMENGCPPEQITLPVTLVVRESTVRTSALPLQQETARENSHEST